MGRGQKNAPVMMVGKKSVPTSGRVERAATSSSKKAKTKRSAKRLHRHDNFRSYIFKVLRQVHPALGISTRAMLIMDSLVKDLLDRVASEAGKLSQYGRRSTLSTRDMQTAVRLVLPGELAKHAVSEGTKAIAKYAHSK